MLSELQKFQTDFELTEQLLSNTMKPLRTKYGVTDDVYAREYEKGDLVVIR